MHAQQTFNESSEGVRKHSQLRVLPQARPQVAALDRSQALVHDLRGMIAIVTSCAAALEAMGKGGSAPLPVELIQRIVRACKAMTMFVDDALVQAKQQGLESSMAERLDLVALISETVALHQAAARQKDVNLEATYSSRHHTLRGSAALLQRALSNLLTNAIKFSPPGSTVSLAVRDRGSAVQIVVADQGPGISPGELETIFDPYVQGGAAATGGERGYGLGLAIARSLIEAQGGQIDVNSEMGRGALFAINLPL